MEQNQELFIRDVQIAWDALAADCYVRGIEAISGASVTSNAALKAINKAMNQNEESLEETAKQEAEPEPEAPETAETTETPEATVTADEVTASEQGFGGDVTVHATLDGDTLKTLAIDTPNETAGLGQRASEAEFTGQFIGKAGPFTYGENGIEALSGATVTSNAALKAINSLFGGGETAEGKEPETAPEATEAPKAETETEKTDETAEGAYAVYRSTKQNNFSKITVIASANGDKLSDVKIISSGEEGMDLLTDAIKEEWAKAILGSGSAAPDAITGATLQYSAGSVTEAMTEILDRMAGKETEAAPEVTEAPTEAPAEEPAEEPTEAPTELPTEEPAPEATEGPAGEEPAKEAPAYAGYRAEAENDFSKVIIIAYAKKGKLASVKILSEEKEGQKDLMTDEIREAWAKAILESGSAAPDAITGATLKISAGSVTEAMTKILEQMAGK